MFLNLYFKEFYSSVFSLLVSIIEAILRKYNSDITCGNIGRAAAVVEVPEAATDQDSVKPNAQKKKPTTGYLSKAIGIIRIRHLNGICLDR